MATSRFVATAPNFYQIFLLLISLSPTIFSQDPSSSSPTIAQCRSSLLPLVPCAPYVQGTALSPGQPCCDNLKRIYSQEPRCLCLLLNDTTLNSFLINRTLALQLPAYCTLQVNISACAGLHVAPSSTASQVSLGTKDNSTAAASPEFSVAPAPSMKGLGFGTSEAVNLKTGGGLAVLMTVVILLFTLVRC